MYDLGRHSIGDARRRLAALRQARSELLATRGMTTLETQADLVRVNAAIVETQQELKQLRAARTAAPRKRKKRNGT